jgi:hypothetical protein
MLGIAIVLVTICVPLLVLDVYLTLKYDTQEDMEKEARKTLEKLVKKHKD